MCGAAMTPKQAALSVLQGCGGGDMITTASTICAIRALTSDPHDSDEAIVSVIVGIAAERAMIVAFDHRL
jgi:formyltetrahydrofolate synthetase